MASCTLTLKSLEEDDFMVFKAKLSREFMKKQMMWWYTIYVMSLRSWEIHDQERAGGVKKAIETKDEHSLQMIYF
jgi:hypothetical protein